MIFPSFFGIKKQKCRKSLGLLYRGAYPLFAGKVGEDGVDLWFSHIGRMTNVVKENEAFHPKAIGLL